MMFRTASRSGYDVRNLSIGRVLADKAEKNGDKIFLRFLPDDTRLSYRDIHIVSNRLANGLIGAGVSPKSHVAVLMENKPQQLLVNFALAKIGAVAVPLNTASRGDMLRYFLDHSESQSIIADADLLERVEEIAGDLQAQLGHAVVVGKSDRSFSGLGTQCSILNYEKLLAGSEENPPVEVKFSDLCSINYTSGTTGRSKGIKLTQARTLLWGLGHVEALGYRSDDVIYVCLPLFHVNAYQGSTFTALMSDASVVLQRRFSASGFWGDIKGSGATAANMLGSMVNILWMAPPKPDETVHKLRMCYTAPVPSFAEAFEKRFGIRFTSGFGLTDFGTTHAFGLADPRSKLGSCGRPRPGMEARIVDENDFDVPSGEFGEVVLRTNNLWDGAGGYFKMPEETLQANRNGWFHTGDVGRIDEDGYLWFTDRKKDVIRRRGENVSAFEIEEITNKHPAISESAAYPVTSSLGEEEIAISIMLVEGASLTEVDYIQYCAQHMPYFMVPRFVTFCEDFPRNQSLKIQKNVLRKESEERIASFWDREKAGITLQR